MPYTILDMQEAIHKIFATHPPRKELTLDKIRHTIAAYFFVDASQIEEAELAAALRATDFALPRPRTRGSSHIAWMFIKRPGDGSLDKPGGPSAPSTPVAGNKPRKYKDKPIAQAFKMKAG